MVLERSVLWDLIHLDGSVTLMVFLAPHLSRDATTGVTPIWTDCYRLIGDTVSRTAMKGRNHQYEAEVFMVDLSRRIGERFQGVPFEAIAPALSHLTSAITGGTSGDIRSLREITLANLRLLMDGGVIEQQDHRAFAEMVESAITIP